LARFTYKQRAKLRISEHITKFLEQQVQKNKKNGFLPRRDKNVFWTNKKQSF
jgi:hypothetical protein